jgi:hypothetical protein
LELNADGDDVWDGEIEMRTAIDSKPSMLWTGKFERRPIDVEGFVVIEQWRRALLNGVKEVPKLTRLQSGDEDQPRCASYIFQGGFMVHCRQSLIALRLGVYNEKCTC